MMGKDIWEDIEIDTYVLQQKVNEMAIELVDHYGKELDEGDLLKLNGYSDYNGNPEEKALCLACLEYYKTKGYPSALPAKVVLATDEKWYRKFWPFKK